jgi:hypothetical protein
MPSIEKRIIGKIYGNGRGWAFSYKDFAIFGVRSTIDWSLYNLNKKRVIRRVIRGIFDYPRFSQNLNRELGPDIDQVARALARKFNWAIEPSGPAALNILGLSTQVPGKYIYRSNGPDRSYTIGKMELSFRNTPTKEIGFDHHESAIIVQALKSLGRERISAEKIARIRDWLDPALRSRVLRDTDTVTGWIYQSIREICWESTNE